MEWGGSLQKLHRPRCVHDVCFPCGILPRLQILYKPEGNSQLDSQETHRCSQHYLRLSEFPLAGWVLCSASPSGTSGGEPLSVHDAVCGLDLGGVCGDDLPPQSLDKHLQHKKGFKSKLCGVIYCKNTFILHQLLHFDSIQTEIKEKTDSLCFNIP